MINRGFDNVGQAGPSGSSEPDAMSDSLSDFNFSDSASMFSETASRRGGPVDEARLAANRQRIAQNKAKFESIKAERNNFKAEARRAAKELDRMRSEVSKVEELKSQLRNLQEARAGGRLPRRVELLEGCSWRACIDSFRTRKRSVCGWCLNCCMMCTPAGHVHVRCRCELRGFGQPAERRLVSRWQDRFLRCQCPVRCQHRRLCQYA